MAGLLAVALHLGPVLADDRPGAFALPLADKTPGVVRPVTIRELCSGHLMIAALAIPRATKETIFASYGIDARQRGAYVIDWLVPPELGGSNDPANLWPQLTVGPLNHGDKVKLHRVLHKLVCSGKVKLATAQKAIEDSWVGAYERYVGRYP